MAVKHGGNLQEISEIYQIEKQDLIDFSANINPLGIPERIKQAINQGLEGLIHYPDSRYRLLKQAIADFHQLTPECVYASNGAAEAIFMLGRVLKVKKLLLLAPTFMEYEAAFQQQATEFCYFDLETRNFQWRVSEFISFAIAEEATGICLCNPNNPTGQMLNQTELDELLTFCQDRGLVLIVDEAFADFSGKEDSLIPKVTKYANLFVLRSLTKMFAIPGLRLGYLLTSNVEILDQIEQVTVPWHINTFADLAGQQALKEQSFIEESQHYIEKERSFLIGELARFSDNIIVYPSQTNFLFFRYLGEDCLQEKLIYKGILIRNCTSFKGLSQNYYRIAVKKRNQNQALVNALEEVLCGK
ncbi:threonine-phosphate decarboxylase [Enterococcus florum]|uniref:threonine-phosphate decarboxylase n=1 Tax=Enterococcus florum TaxID=2480627 RepID=A0A4P5PAQ6_9ENTE|nr:threonine-phosphate decarboxylase CobD [Enterococcus florum]GCF95195.1 threonine-phosphate decarboxylase [Enterococcus florum]